MGKAKRFNAYDSEVSEKRKLVQGYGQARQNMSGISSTFRSPGLTPIAVSSASDSSGTGTGKFVTVSLAADQTANLNANDHVEFDTLDEDGGTVLQTGAGQADGIFELGSGTTYYLTASLRPEYSGSTGEMVIVWYDITNSAEIGSRGIYVPPNTNESTSNQPVCQATITPASNITVEVRIISETALTALANEYCQASLFEIALGGTGAGGGGSGGVTTLPGLTDVTITGAVKGDIIAYDGAAWVDLTVGSDGEFLKALASETTGLVWGSTSGTEVPVWTQLHDADGFNFIFDTDGDSGFINDRDALIADDQLGIALGGLGTINYFFYQGGGAQNFDIIETASGDAFQIAQTTTTGSINTNALLLKIAGTEVVKIESDGLTMSQEIDMNGADIIIDVDGDTVIGDGGVDDQFQISTGGSARVVFSNTVAAFGENIFMNSTFDIDLNAQDLILDADNDTLISAAVDDNIQFTTGASARMTVSNSSLLMAVDIDLNGVGDLIMDADADTKIESTADDNIQIVTGASTRCVFSNSSLLMAMPIDMGGQDIQNGGVIFLTEQAEAEADITAKGQIWVDTQTPNKLFFTGDDGVDHDLIAAASGVTFPVTPTIKDHSTTWTNNVAIDLALTTAHIQKITLDANLIWATPSNPPSSGTQIEFEIEYVQDSTGGWTVTQWSEVVETVNVSLTANAVTIVTYRTNDGGSNYHAVPSLRGSINLSGVDTANKQLSNLGTTAINADLIMGSNDVTGLATLIFTNGNFGGGAAVSHISSDVSGDMVFNVADADQFQLAFQNSLVWAIDKNKALGNAIILTDSLTLNDAAADPAVAGEIQRSGADLKVFTGGAVKNISNMVVNPIAADFDPASTSTYNLGSSSEVWAALFVDRVRFNASTTFISFLSDQMVFELPSGDSFNWEVNNTDQLTLSSTDMDLHGNTMSGLTQLTWDDGNVFASTPSEMSITFPAAADHFTWDFNSNERYEWGEGTTQFKSADGTNLDWLFERIDAGMDDGDVIMQTDWQAEDSANNPTDYVRETITAQDVTSGSEAGGWKIEVATGTGGLGGGIEVRGDANTGTNVGVAFFGGTPVPKQNITGARDEPEGALADLLNKLALFGLILDSTTAS